MDCAPSSSPASTRSRSCPKAIGTCLFSRWVTRRPRSPAGMVSSGSAARMEMRRRWPRWSLAASPVADSRCCWRRDWGKGHHLSRLLTGRGFAVERHEVYVATAASFLPEAARVMIGANRQGRVLLFSRETALCLSRLTQETDLLGGFSTLDLAAISRPVAEAVRHLPWRSIRVAMAPTETAVLALLHD